MNLQRCLLLAALIVIICPAFAQQVKIKNTEFVNGKLLIRYDLIDSVEGRAYSIRAYSSSDGFLNPLEKIAGEAGLEIKPGEDKKIEWAFNEELPATFDGRVSIEIRARIFIPFINAQSLNQYKVFKRKRKYNITWTGGTPQNVLNFDLYHGKTKFHTFPNVANVGHYTLEFPSHIRPGNGYRFRISDIKNKEEVVFTEEFKVKRKIPLLIKALPIALAGYGIYLITQGSDNSPIDEGIGGPPNPATEIDR